MEGREKWRRRIDLDFFKPRIRRIFTNSALPRDCCSGVSMSARGSSDSAVIDSRYKPAWQRECLSRSRRPCSPLSRSGALFAEDSPCWFCSCSFVLFVVQNSTDKGHGVHRGRVEGRGKWRRTDLDFLTELTEFQNLGFFWNLEGRRAPQDHSDAAGNLHKINPKRCWLLVQPQSTEGEKEVFYQRRYFLSLL